MMIMNEAEEVAGEGLSEGGSLSSIVSAMVQVHAMVVLSCILSGQESVAAP